MKRLIPAGILALIIIIVCVISNIQVTKTIEKSKKQIEKCEQLYLEKDYHQAENTARDFKKNWTKTAKIISAYSNHCPLDDISALASVLPETVNHKNDFEFKATINQIKTSLDTIKSEQSLTFESLY